MSLSSEDVKEIKATLTQILHNQTVMIAQLVCMSKQQLSSNQPSSNQTSSSSNTRVPALTPMALIDSVKAMTEMKPAAAALKTVKKELPLVELTNGVRNMHRIRKNDENGPIKAKKLLMTSPTPNQRVNMMKSLTPNQRLCSICNIGVKVEEVVEHIWEHIRKKVLSEKDANYSNMHSYLCDIKGCKFRTNKLSAAKLHAQESHANLDSSNVVLDNTENTTPLFQQTLAQCFDTISDTEKEKFHKIRFN